MNFFYKVPSNLIFFYRKCISFWPSFLNFIIKTNQTPNKIYIKQKCVEEMGENLIYEATVILAQM